MSSSDSTIEVTDHEERLLDWEGALNARDTGGLLTADGRRIRRGALVRSDVLTRLTPSGRQALLEHGVRTIVDVRGGDELDHDGDSYPFKEPDAQVQYLNVAFVVDGPEAAQLDVHKLYQAATTREEYNRLDLSARMAGIGAIVKAIAAAQPGGVLVHCHAGKDRTGIVVALLLSLVGVTDEHIADDYALTALNLEPLIADWLAVMGGDEAERRRHRAFAEPRREVMLDTLAFLRERYGSAEEYLVRAGVTREEIARIRARLVDDQGDTPT